MTFVTLIIVISLTASPCSIVYAFSWEDPQGPRPILGEPRRKFRSSTVAPGYLVRIGPPNAISQPQRSLIDGYTRRQQCPYQRSPYCGPSHCCPSLTQPSGPWFAHAPVSFTPDEITSTPRDTRLVFPPQNPLKTRFGTLTTLLLSQEGSDRLLHHALHDGVLTVPSAMHRYVLPVIWPAFGG